MRRQVSRLGVALSMLLLCAPTLVIPALLRRDKDATRIESMANMIEYGMKLSDFRDLVGIEPGNHATKPYAPIEEEVVAQARTKVTMIGWGKMSQYQCGSLAHFQQC